MSTISTHILDTSRGKPARGVHVVLEAQEAAGLRKLGEGRRCDEQARDRDDGELPHGSVRNHDGVAGLQEHVGMGRVPLQIGRIVETVFHESSPRAP